MIIYFFTIDVVIIYVFSCLPFVILLIFLSSRVFLLAVGLPTGSGLALLLDELSAIIQFVAPPTSSCSNRLPVGVRYYYGGVLCINCSFCFFRNMCGNFALVRPSHLRMMHQVAHSSLRAVCPDRFVEHFYVSEGYILLFQLCLAGN